MRLVDNFHEVTAPQRWASDYCRRRDAVYLMFALHWYGRAIAQWMVP